MKVKKFVANLVTFVLVAFFIFLGIKLNNFVGFFGLAVGLLFVSSIIDEFKHLRKGSAGLWVNLLVAYLLGFVGVVVVILSFYFFNLSGALKILAGLFLLGFYYIEKQKFQLYKYNNFFSDDNMADIDIMFGGLKK